MKAIDLKEVIVPQVGVKYSAIEKNVEVYGSDSTGWKVWVTIGNTTECINPKHTDGSVAKYSTSSLAISKANRYILRNNK